MQGIFILRTFASQNQKENYMKKHDIDKLVQRAEKREMRRKNKNIYAKQKKEEADARRKTAKKWQSLEKTKSYKKTVLKFYCDKMTDELKDELFDGILISLKKRNEEKSIAVKQRIIRRVVEKKLAQSTHRFMNRTEDMLTNSTVRSCVRRSMKTIKRYQMCM